MSVEVISALVVGALAVAGGVVTFLRACYMAWRRIDGFLLDWNGDTRDGHVPIPSMPQRVYSLETAVYQITHQITPNGGNTESLADRVVRIERTLTQEK
jgi:hypothetical protein